MNEMSLLDKTSVLSAKAHGPMDGVIAEIEVVQISVNSCCQQQLVLLLAGVNSTVVRFCSGDHLCHCEVAFNVLLMNICGNVKWSLMCCWWLL